MVFITHKVLNQLHSDTIACVLYELLVCRSLGFGIVFRDFPSRLRFHKFQYCSIFKVLRCLKQLVYFTSSSLVCQVLFLKFLKQSFQSAAVFRTTLLEYHIRFDLSTTFLKFFQIFLMFLCPARRNISGAACAFQSGVILAYADSRVKQKMRRSHTFVESHSFYGSALEKQPSFCVFSFTCQLFAHPFQDLSFAA